jgi:hypothetical protein
MSGHALTKATTALLALLLPPLAHAELLRIVASGSGPVVVSDELGLLPFPSASGTGPYSIAMTLDTAVTDDYPNDPITGVYLHSLSAITLSDGVTTLDGWDDTAAVVITNDQTWASVQSPITDFWTAQTSSTSAADAEDTTRTWKMLLTFRGDSQSFPAPPLASDALVAPPPLSAWTGGSIAYFIYDTTNTAMGREFRTVAMANVVVDSLTITAVPVPPAAALALPAFVGVLCRARRRRP